jgi:NAD(P)-dependent dehydrogenase (short-subunit alcohol dehydrogenase family)
MSKIALITGGNRGIGFEICRQLAGRGVHVILTARDTDRGLEAAESIGRGAAFYPLDVDVEPSIDVVAEALETSPGRLDVLINNAGINDEDTGTVETDLDAARRVMETNFYGPWRLSQALLPLLEKSSEGRIINITSGMGQLDGLTGGHAAYRLSKSALNALTILMANELRASGVTVNAVRPGWVRTDMGGADAPRSVEQGADTAVWLATLPDGGPTGKLFQDRAEIAW